MPRIEAIPAGDVHTRHHATHTASPHLSLRRHTPPAPLPATAIPLRAARPEDLRQRSQLPRSSCCTSCLRHGTCKQDGNCRLVGKGMGAIGAGGAAKSRCAGNQTAPAPRRHTWPGAPPQPPASPAPPCAITCSADPSEEGTRARGRRRAKQRASLTRFPGTLIHGRLAK